MKKIISISLYIIVFVVYAISRTFSDVLPANTGSLGVVSVPDSVVIYDSTVKKQTPASDAPVVGIEVVKTGRNRKTTKTSPVSMKSEPVMQHTPMQMHKSVYVDGVYTGLLADAYYERFQVETVIKGGVITKVYLLPYKQNNNTSRYINNYAVPILRSEALTAQSAKVDTISGATETSKAFRTSLTSALQKAS